MEEEFKMDELYHHGVKGQKWGIRRYQNPDGSLTAAGKRKYGTKANFEKVQAAKKKVKVKAKADKVRAKQNARTEKELEKYEAKYKKKAGIKEESSKAKTKSKAMSEMTDEELRSKIQRIQLENQLKALQPEKVSKGKAFMRSLGKDVIAPAFKDVGRQYLTKVLKEAAGLDKQQKSREEKAKENAEYWKNMNTMAQQKEQYEKRMEAEKRQQQAAKQSKKDEKQAEKDKKQAERDKKNEEKEAQQNLKDLKSAVDDYVNSSFKSTLGDKIKSAKETKEAKQNLKDLKSAVDDYVNSAFEGGSDREISRGTVFGEGTSHKEFVSRGEEYSKSYVDDVFKDLSSTSGAVQVYGNIGQTYIAGLLEDKSR